MLETETLSEVVDAMEKCVDRFHAAHREDDLIFVHKWLEIDDNAIYIGDIVLTILVLAKLNLGPVLQVKDTKLSESTADRSRDARERGGFKVVLDVTKPRFISTSAEIYWYPYWDNCRGHTRRYCWSRCGV